MAADVARAPGVIPFEVLARVPGCEGGDPPLAVAPLPGGRGCNRILRVDTRQGRFVWRQREAPVNRPGSRAVDELRAHSLAAEAGLAPAVLAADPAGQWLLMEYIDAPAWREARLCSAEGAARLAAQLARLHAVPVPVDWPPVDAVAMADDYLRELAVAAPPDAVAALAPLRAQIVALSSAIAVAGLPCALHHGDLTASNLLGEGPLLVDWEYAQIAEPGWDLACLLTYYPELARNLPTLLAGTDLVSTAGGVLDLQRQRFALLNRLWEQLVTIPAG